MSFINNRVVRLNYTFDNLFCTMGNDQKIVRNSNFHWSTVETTLHDEDQNQLSIYARDYRSQSAKIEGRRLIAGWCSIYKVAIHHNDVTYPIGRCITRGGAAALQSVWWYTVHRLSLYYSSPLASWSSRWVPGARGTTLSQLT